MPANNSGIAVDQVGSNRYCQQVTVPGITSGAYSAGQAVGTIMTFPKMASSLGSGRLTGVVITDVTTNAASASLSLMIFKAALGTPIANKAAFSVAAADVPNVLCGITPDPTAFFVLGTPVIWSTAFYQSGNGAFTYQDFDLGQGKTSLYAQLYTATTPDWGATANPLTVTLNVEMD